MCRLRLNGYIAHFNACVREHGSLCLYACACVRICACVCMCLHAECAGLSRIGDYYASISMPLTGGQCGYETSLTLGLSLINAHKHLMS